MRLLIFIMALFVTLPVVAEKVDFTLLDLDGKSVSLSADGGRVAIGAHGNDGNGSDSGYVRVYGEALFADGFETGDTSRWTSAVP